MITLLLTIHNQEAIIEDVIAHAVANAEALEKIIILFDGCTDRSKEIVMNYITNLAYIPIETYDLPNVFETKANNFGLQKVTSPYAIILQDDCIITEPGYDLKLLEPVKYPDVFAVSGRNAHNIVPSPTEIVEYPDVAGWGTKFNEENILYIRQVVNRGPLLLNMDVVRRLNYFDESFAPQSCDDHDLCLRAFKLGYVCGCRKISFISEPAWGGTRKGDNSWWQIAFNKNKKIILDRHFNVNDTIGFCLTEEREL